MLAKHLKRSLREEKALKLFQWSPMPGTLYGRSGWYQSPYYKPMEKMVDGLRDDMIIYFERVYNQGKFLILPHIFLFLQINTTFNNSRRCSEDRSKAKFTKVATSFWPCFNSCLAKGKKTSYQREIPFSINSYCRSERCAFPASCRRRSTSTNEHEYRWADELVVCKQ